jgi:hypothetical protein
MKTGPYWQNFLKKFIAEMDCFADDTLSRLHPEALRHKE